MQVLQRAGARVRALSARRFFADVPAAVEEATEGELAVVEDTAAAVARRMEQTGASPASLARPQGCCRRDGSRAAPLRRSAVALRAWRGGARGARIFFFARARGEVRRAPALLAPLARALSKRVSPAHPALAHPPLALRCDGRLSRAQSPRGAVGRSSTESRRSCRRRTPAMRALDPSLRSSLRGASPKFLCRRSMRCKARHRGFAIGRSRSIGKRSGATA